MNICNLIPFLWGLGGAVLSWWAWKSLSGNRDKELLDIIDQKEKSLRKWRREYEGQVDNFNALTRNYKRLDSERGELEGYLSDWRDKWTSLDGENVSLNGRYSTLSSEYDDYRRQASADMEALQYKWNGIQEKFDKLSANYSGALSEIESGRKNISLLESSVSDYKADVSKLDKRLSHSQEELTTLKNQYTELEARSKELRSGLIDSQKKVVDANMELGEQPAKHTELEIESWRSKYNRLETSLSDLESIWKNKNAHLEKQLSDVKKQLSERSANIETWKSKHKRAIAEFGAFKTKYGNLENRFLNVESRLKSSQSEIRDWKTKYNNLGVSHNRLDYETGAQKSEIEGHLKARKVYDNNLSVLQNKLNANRNLLASWENKYNRLEANHQELMARQKLIKAEVAQWRKKYNKLDLSLSTQRTKSNAAKSDISNWKTKYETLNAKFSSANQSLSTWKKKYATLESDLQRKVSQSNAKSTDLRKSSFDMETLQTKIKLHLRTIEELKADKAVLLKRINTSESGRSKENTVKFDLKNKLKYSQDKSRTNELALRKAEKALSDSSISLGKVVQRSDSWQAKVKELEKELVQAKKDNAIAFATIRKLEMQVGDWQSKYANIFDEKDLLKIASDKLKEKLKVYKRRVGNKQREAQGLENELKTLKSKTKSKKKPKKKKVAAKTKQSKPKKAKTKTKQKKEKLKALKPKKAKTKLKPKVAKLKSKPKKAKLKEKSTGSKVLLSKKRKSGESGAKGRSSKSKSKSLTKKKLGKASKSKRSVLSGRSNRSNGRATTKKKSTGDDLTKIEGIGPAIQKLLKKKGIRTWNKLSKAKIGKLREILEQGGSRFKMHDPGTWSRQANLAAKGKWDRLSTLQDKLNKGK